MGLLTGKKGLIFGLANKNSIAWGIARALHAEGAEMGFSYGFPQLERRVRPLAAELGVDFIEECNIEDDETIAATFGIGQLQRHIFPGCQRFYPGPGKCPTHGPHPGSSFHRPAGRAMSRHPPHGK